ncbi:MAG: hypothetical protein GXO76_06620 [Calditrichaeota bacterium]|nr:hypothetical protein [Calditrichota bacterium]
MKKTVGLFAVLILLFTVHTGFACYTIVAGKKATADGSVLVGHNEDDSGRRLFNLWRVPRLHHEPGEVVQLKNGGTLPQVPTTWSYLWIESVDQSFSDYAINEWGVTVASNACPSIEDKSDLTDGGISFMLRHLIVQRAKTAREGVELAGKLLDRFGYAALGRTLTIADPNEAWLLAMVRGKHWVAERVPDDRVVLQANIFIIRQVHFNDPKNFITSKDNVRDYAIRRGWYDPKSGKPFDFAAVFNRIYDKKYASRGYDTRQWRGQQLLSGKTTTVQEALKNGLPFSVKPAHKLTPADLMIVLRDHYEGTPYDVTVDKKGNPNRSFERTICTAATQHSTISQLRAGLPPVVANVVWLSFGRPDVNTYVPFYAGIPEGPRCMHFVPGQDTWENSFAHHFNPLPGTFDYRPDKAFWIFNDLENLMGLNYYKTIGEIQSVWNAQEKEAFALQPSVENTAIELLKTNREMAEKFIRDYSFGRLQKALRTSKELTQKIKGEIYN